MGDFVSGILIENAIGAIYEDVVYDRWLKLRLQSDDILTIFDYLEPISNELIINHRYEVILQPTIFTSLHYFPDIPAKLEQGDWQGRVVNPFWHPATNDYHYFQFNLVDTKWILVATPIGQMIINPHAVLRGMQQHPPLPTSTGQAITNPNETALLVQAGGYLRWQHTRIDLQAVI